MTPSTGIKMLAMSDHRRVSGGCRDRSMNRYIWPFEVTPAVQKIVMRRGTYRIVGAGPPNKKPELPARTRYTTRIAATVDSVVPIHLNNTPRLAFAACCGPYSSAPWCIRITAIRLTMKLMTKTVTSSVADSGTDGLAGGNPRSRRRVEDLKSRRGNVVLAQLAERDEARVLRVRTRERIPSDVFTEDIDQDVVPANLRAFELDEVPYIEDAERPHVDPGLLQGLPDRSRLHRLSDLQGPARQAPPALVRFGATLDQENSSISEHDCADRGDRALWELVPRRHRSGKSMQAINPTSEPRKCSR